MKNVKRMMAFVAAMVMVAAMGLTAFATNDDPAGPDYSITVNNAKAGETYTAYKMFDLSVDDPSKPSAFRYTVNSAWTGFANTDEFKAIFTVDAQGYITTEHSDQEAWSGTSAFSVLADAAAKYAQDNSISPAGSVTVAEGSTSGKIELSGPGYYVISSTIGSRAMIESTPSESAVTVNEKNEVDSIDKKVQEDSTSVWGTENDAQIGDTVNFKSEVTIAARSINVKIHDTMDSGLTLNPTSIKIYTDEGLQTEYTSATIKTGEAADQGDTFTIEIPDAFAATAVNSQELYIVYSAEVNSSAVANGTTGVAIVDQNNKTKVSFGNGSSSLEVNTTTTTHKFEVLKHRTGSQVNLADAVFALKKNGTVVNLIKLDDTNYRVVDDTESGTASSHANNGEVATVAANTIVSDFVTVSSGNIVIWGVDSDSDYMITELQAPKGYNLLADPVSVTVAAANNTVISVENKTGTELPSTGGIGTTIFYIIGAILVVIAGVLLVTRRRMKDE